MYNNYFNTAYFHSLFDAKFSTKFNDPERKAKEEAAFVHFMDFLEECEGKIYLTTVAYNIASTCAHICMVIMGIFRASMEPFWDLKIIIIEYHMHVSSEYLQAACSLL